MLLKTLVWRIIVLIAFLSAAINKLDAQSESQIPPFKMLLSNGKFFGAADLPKDKAVVLIYFAPDCEHCQVLMNEFFQKIDTFRKLEIVLVTFKPVDEVSAFERRYGTNRYENIKVGTEGTTFYLRQFFKLQNTPFTALYNKQGKLVYSYRKETSVKDLIDRTNQL